MSQEQDRDEPFARHVSVVIVSWNHRSCLPDCLGSLASQNHPQIDITVVDNASQDGSAEWVAANAPDVRLIQLATNQGFSRAFNLGARTSMGEFVLSLNPDVCARPDFIKELVLAAQQDEQIGIVSPKLLRADDPSHLDSTGLFLDRRRFPYDRGQMEVDQGRYDENTEVFGACGAAALFRRAMLQDLAHPQDEYFDEDFFAYYEDADLAWRAKLSGWRCVYAPGAVAEHIRGWGDTLRKHAGQNGAGPRYALRNRYLMLVKNDSINSLLRDLVWILPREVQRLTYMLLFRRDALGGISDFFQLLPEARRKRREIQTRRTVPPLELRRWFVRRSG